MKIREALLAVALMVTGTAVGQDGPTMGWSSWNTFGVQISENIIKGQADAMVSKGLKDVGYDHINIDDGYFGGRDKNDGHLLSFLKIAASTSSRWTSVVAPIIITRTTWCSTSRNATNWMPDIDYINVVSTASTGIREIVNGKLSNSQIYDLSGRKVTTPRKGINIINGRKVTQK